MQLKEGSKARAAATRLKNKEAEELASVKLQIETKVWLNGQTGSQGATARKRGRQPSTPAKSNKKVRKETGQMNDVDNETVDIPVPAAPKKRVQATRPVQQNIERSAFETDSSVTEPETDEFASDVEGASDHSNDVSDIDSQGGNQGHAIVPSARKPRTARKQQFDEQPRWSEQPPNSSSSKAGSHVIVRNRIVEIPDDESSNETSPTPQVASGLTTDVVDGDSDSDTESSGDDGDHPGFTDLIHIPGRELSLGHQVFEVKLVIRKAMGLVVDRLLFLNGFPSLATRAIWDRRCLINACDSIEQCTGTHAKGRYRQLLQRIRSDAEYVKELSKLLDARLPITRGNLKTIAATYVIPAYDLGLASKDYVFELLKDMKYIYPPLPNGRGVIGSKPYQHKVIIDILRDFLFGPHSTVSAVTRRHFDPAQEHQNKFPPSTIALVATAVCAALDEWRTGRRLSVLFSSNIYTDIYNNHMILLKNIEERNENAYNHLLRRLYVLASGDAPVTQISSMYLDTENMATDA